MRVDISEDEMFPVYHMSDKGHSYEVPDELVAEWRTVFARFLELNGQLGDIFDAQYEPFIQAYWPDETREPDA